MKTLYIIRGIAGSGKTTFANTIVDSIAVCEADQYFVDKETGEYKFNPDEIKIAHQWCKDEVENRMKFIKYWRADKDKLKIFSISF